MYKLLILYDDEIKDKGRDMYLKQIKKYIPKAKIRPIFDNDDIGGVDKLLFLQPVTEITETYLGEYIRLHPHLDVEGRFTDKLTITAEAVFNVLNSKLKALRGKNILILNQSKVLGISLADVLIRSGANVFSCNSSMTDIETLAYFIKFDAIVTATGNKDFKIPERITKNIEVKIDLSDDLEDTDKITSVPTVKVLRERLEK